MAAKILLRLDHRRAKSDLRGMVTLIDTNAAPTLRHPEKRNRPESAVLRKPEWLRVKLPTGPEYAQVRKLVDEHKLHTICESGNCPNMGECWGAGTATFMILGNICTRSCGFCGVKTGRPETVATTPGSHTGEFLKPLLAHRVTEAKKPTKRKPRKKAA